jgi:hypothetical protein
MNKIIKTALVLLVLITTVFVVAPAKAADSLTVTAPNGGEVYRIGNTMSVRWTSNVTSSADVSIAIYKLKGLTWNSASEDKSQYLEDLGFDYITEGGITNSGQFNWTVPAPYANKTGNYVAEVRAFGYQDPQGFNAAVGDWSDNFFRIESASQTGNAPTINQITPSPVAIGGTITIKGSNFLSSNKINIFRTGESMTQNRVSSTDGQTITLPIDFFLPGQYSLSVENTNGISAAFPVTIIDNSSGSAHSVGTNVLGSDGTVYFISTGNTRSPYTSAGAFLSYKFNTWASVVSASSADMALPLTTYTPNGSTQVTTYFIPPRNGSLINDKGTVYLITNGLRAGFTLEKVFKELGFSFSNVYPGDTSFMATLAPINSSAIAHPDGTLINDNGTIYVMKNGNRMGFPSMAIFDSWGYWMGEAVKANSYDRQAPVSGVIQTRMSNQLSI